jgi:NTP pyrophosphatase (non-canonical NTP hydrolase)
MDIDQLSEEIEVVSQNYAKKFNIERDADWFVFKLQEEIGELTQAYLMMKGRSRMKGKDMEEIRKDFEEEIGDVFCHILLLSKHFNVEVKKVIDEKWLKWNNAKELSGGA